MNEGNNSNDTRKEPKNSNEFEKAISDQDIKNDGKQISKFPTHVLPDVFLKLVKECENTLNFPPDYIATSILSAVSTAIGTSAMLVVKTGWNELAVLYV
ncbi:MAG: hypothetical protein IPI93_14300 [Sphingobacteriaceae bacterium]|nr:hypothetical protein [Sphingobacteriaceae bacterium]